jgi:hypothetical protein
VRGHCRPMPPHPDPLPRCAGEREHPSFTGRERAPVVHGTRGSTPSFTGREGAPVVHGKRASARPSERSHAARATVSRRALPSHAARYRLTPPARRRIPLAPA